MWERGGLGVTAEGFSMPTDMLLLRLSNFSPPVYRGSLQALGKHLLVVHCHLRLLMFLWPLSKADRESGWELDWSVSTKPRQFDPKKRRKKEVCRSSVITCFTGLDWLLSPNSFYLDEEKQHCVVIEIFFGLLSWNEQCGSYRYTSHAAVIVGVQYKERIIGLSSTWNAVCSDLITLRTRWQTRNHTVP